MSFESLLIEDGKAPDLVDETGAPAVTYLAWAAPGTVDGSESKFKIKKITNVAGITTTTYAGGTRDYDKIWNNRTLLTYSFLV